MDGYFFFTAALTLAFSAGVPDCATRERAFLACASFSIGYFRLSGSAKDLAGSAFRAALVSFAICHLIIRNETLSTASLLETISAGNRGMHKADIPFTRQSGLVLTHRNGLDKRWAKRPREIAKESRAQQSRRTLS
jgi:hypothetical protein